MSKRKYAIGVDFGTESGRAVLVDVSNGEEIATAVYPYSHGVIDEALPGSKARLDNAGYTRYRSLPSRPDRVLVLDNCSTDRTEEIVRNFKDLACEFIRNPTNLGLFGNLNRCLEFAAETEFLHILHADDAIAPRFYEVMTGALADCAGPAPRRDA